MLIVETIAKIRRLHFNQGLGIKTICRELNLSKKVVRKVVRSGATEFTYKRTVQPRPKLGAWTGELDRLLEVNAARGSREKLALMQVYEELRGLGYEGSYDAVRRYAAGWKRAQGSGTAAAFVPLLFAPGEGVPFQRRLTRELMHTSNLLRYLFTCRQVFASVPLASGQARAANCPFSPRKAVRSPTLLQHPAGNIRSIE